jgi:hypothetical protein
LRLHWLVNVIVAQAWQKDPLLAAETFVAAAMPSRAGFAANSARAAKTFMSAAGAAHPPRPLNWPFPFAARQAALLRAAIFMYQTFPHL